jgi:hypothetical protein
MRCWYERVFECGKQITATTDDAMTRKERLHLKICKICTKDNVPTKEDLVIDMCRGVAVKGHYNAAGERKK